MQAQGFKNLTMQKLTEQQGLLRAGTRLQTSPAFKQQRKVCVGRSINGEVQALGKIETRV